VIQEQGVQVSPKRFRIPDICVTLGEPNEEILRQPPFICIEVLSPEDRWPRIQQRIDDYLAMGVPMCGYWTRDQVGLLGRTSPARGKGYRRPPDPEPCGRTSS
jgi:Uma2 family endonuclease